METRDRGLELKVGIFVAVGLAILAGLVVEFGRLGEGFQTYYSLTIHFEDASGLLKSSDVLMGGAKIGQVSDQPRLVRDERGVDVPLRIYDYARIPNGASFTVGSAGLLGDRFVQVIPLGGEPKGYIEKGARIEGAREKGISELTQEGGKLVGDLRGAVAKIDAVVDRLNAEALSRENMDHLKSTFDNLNKTSAALAASSQKIDGAIAKAGDTLDSAKTAADKLQLVMGDARETLQSADRTVQKAATGNGPLALLLTNAKVAEDLRALISNLRSHGVLFYRDTAAKNPSPTPVPKRPR